MNDRDGSPAMSQASWQSLRRFAQPPAPVERCELCSVELPAEHEHVVEPTTRKLLCSCTPCAILFSHQAETKYRRVPRDARPLPEFQLSDAQWDSLLIPIGLAFFFRSTPLERVVAIYPSPAGPTESLLDLSAWQNIVDDNPALEDMEPDTQALLVNRVRQTRRYLLAPIDRCYQLVGLIRLNWRGISGGEAVWQEIDRFFEHLDNSAMLHE